MTEYLKDATDFTDIPKREPAYGFTHECPRCAGHGRWNLLLDAYGEKQHFQSICGQCDGYGYVNPGTVDATCLHEFEEQPSKEMFLHIHRCRKCGRTKCYDSSD